MTYCTFTRAATDWESFSRAKKVVYDRGLTLAEARAACEDFNRTRTPTQIRSGLKMEFTQGDQP